MRFDGGGPDDLGGDGVAEGVPVLQTLLLRLRGLPLEGQPEAVGEGRRLEAAVVGAAAGWCCASICTYNKYWSIHRR